jgi:UDP-3-O-[3-hydroxymyristoyl] glucosamine N-acyltransferase
VNNERGPTIHLTAVVEDGARVGADTAIWHHAHVRAGATIGEKCILGKNVYVDAGVRIGDRCKIQNNVSLYDGVELGDEVFVGPSAVFTNDLHPRAHPPQGWKVVPTRVGTGVSIGANATIICGVSLGDWSTIGAGSVVTSSTERHELVVGNPARRIGWTCRCGAVLSRSDSLPMGTDCPACGSTIDGAG